jgi:hypothetical protein
MSTFTWRAWRQWTSAAGMRPFWRRVPLRARLLLMLAVGFTFATIGFVTDIVSLGGTQPWRLAFNVAFAGTVAVCYLLVALEAGPLWIAPVLLVHLSVPWAVARLFPGSPALRSPGPDGLAELGQRLTLDGAGVLACMVLGYTCFVAFIGREGIRSLRAFTEVELASRIHASLVPAVTGARGPWEYYGRSVPSGEVGGDLVDVVPIDGDWLGSVADVSGHGVASGVVMAMVKSGARMHLRREFDVARLASELNDVLCTLLEPNMFVTAALVLGRTDGRLDIASAGHLPVVRVSAPDRRPEPLIASGIALGVTPGQPFFKREVVAAKGDVFLLLTDGFTEVFDEADEEFGMHRVEQTVAERLEDPLEAIADGVASAVRAHGAQMDDQTILLARFTGTERPAR